MANINEAFPSDYLRAADLQGNSIRVTIDDCVMEEIGRGRDASRKPVLYFKGKKKGLALNKTNSMTIAQAFGMETDDWRGAEVELFPAMVDYQGKQVEAIRVRIPMRRTTANERPRDDQPPPRPQRADFVPPPDGAPSRGPLNDDIPF